MLDQALSKPPQFKRPSMFYTLLEPRAAIEFLSLAWHLGELRNVPRGNGRSLILVPGYKADDHSMRPLGFYLTQIGYDVHYAKLGRNQGDVELDIERLKVRVQTLSSELCDIPITLIGWSLGGLLAREVTRILPKIVDEVITFGTPIVGGPKFTVIGQRFIEQKQLDMEALEQDIHERNTLGFEQPITSIYSKTDGIVSWRASIDRYNSQAKNVEVTGPHLGLGLNPDVWKLVAYTLAESSANSNV